MDDKTFLAKRRDRAIATFLGLKEREVDPYLPERVAAALRKEFLDQINGLCDLAFDMIADDVVINEEFKDRFNKIYDILTNDGAKVPGVGFKYAEVRDG